MQKADSLVSRYLFKLVGNLIQMLGSIITTLLAPRALGPAAYGIYGFITEFFIHIFSSSDSGTSNALFTKLSQRQTEHEVISFYWHVVFVINILILLFVGAVFFTGYAANLWPEVATKYVFFGFVFASLSFSFEISNKIIDALGYTVLFEKIRMIQVVFKILLILLLVFTHNLNLTTFFVFHILLLILLLVGIFSILKKKKVSQFKSLSYEVIVSYFKEFWTYSSPLIIYSMFGLIAVVGDKWILQEFAGSIEQGFFTLAYQLGSICFLFTRAMTPLFHRELAIGFEKKSDESISSIVNKFLPIFFIIAAFMSFFALGSAKEIVSIVAGSKYENSVLTISIMLLYPIHQTYGQLVGSIYYASGETKVFRNIGIVFMTIGLISTFLLIAPKSLFGLDLKSMGLAIKTVIIQFITVNVLIFFIANKIKVSFFSYLKHQIVIMIILGLSSYLSNEVIKESLFENSFAIIICRLLIYTLASLVLGGIAYLLKINLVLDKTQKAYIKKYLKV